MLVRYKWDRGKSKIEKGEDFVEYCNNKIFHNWPLLLENSIIAN